MPTAIASAPITGSVESVPVLRWTSWVGFKDIPHPKSLVQQVPCCHLTARKPMDVRETATIIVAVSGRNNRSLWIAPYRFVHPCTKMVKIPGGGGPEGDGD